MPSKERDVVVIGAGLGGLLVAAMLARRGRDVLVLEQGAEPGGRLRSYDVDGFVVDAGAYLWPDAHLSRALEEAGATDFQASRIPGTEVLRIFVQGRSGERFSFPWPGRQISAKLSASAAATLQCTPATLQRLAILWQRFAAMAEEEVRSFAQVPLRDALPRLAPDPELAAALRRNVMLFGTYDPDSAAAEECIRLARHPAAPAWPECAGANQSGGVRALARAVAAAAQRAGATLRTHSRVERIALESGRVAGVHVAPATPFEDFVAARHVISNVPVWELFRIVSPRHFPPAFVDHARRFTAVGGTVGAAFAFADLPRLRHGGEPDTFRGWTRLLIGAQAEFGGGMLWTSHHSPHNAPAGQHLLQAMRLTSHAELADADRVGIYHRAFRSMLDEIYLDAAEKLLWERRWITRDGSEYMICSAARPPVRAPGIDGLYFVGETVDVPAVQIDAAALSALRCAELVAGAAG
jgi:phytoene dehydrogenase-like protein